jgi:predicted lipid-binding transport protein (Tim44 family)
LQRCFAYIGTNNNFMVAGMDPINLVLLAIAAVVVWRLWSVLGTRTGFEKPPIVLQPAPEKANENQRPQAPLDGEILAPENKPPVWQGHAAEGSAVAQGLESIEARSPGFSVSSFLRGASAAYEMVLEAFASGNKKALKPLLASDIFASFSGAIDERVAQGRSMKFQFVAVKSTELKRAHLSGNLAQIEMAIVAEMISATLDKDGTVLEGDDKAIRTITDTWTFERDVTSRDPNWKLVATEDNE